jgi:hypothetical protein
MSAAYAAMQNQRVIFCTIASGSKRRTSKPRVFNAKLSFAALRMFRGCSDTELIRSSD